MSLHTLRLSPSLDEWSNRPKLESYTSVFIICMIFYTSLISLQICHLVTFKNLTNIQMVWVKIQQFPCFLKLFPSCHGDASLLLLQKIHASDMKYVCYWNALLKKLCSLTQKNNNNLWLWTWKKNLFSQLFYKVPWGLTSPPPLPLPA